MEDEIHAGCRLTLEQFRRVEKLISDSNLLIFAAERELKIFTSQIQQRKDRERLFGGDGDNPASRRVRNGWKAPIKTCFCVRGEGWQKKPCCKRKKVD